MGWINRLDITYKADRLERQIVRRLASHQDSLLRVSIDLLRISLGLVFVLFGALKFVPGLSPAEGMATQTMARLTFGLMPDGLSLIVVAVIETTIGFCLLTGRHLRLGLALLGMAMIGVLSPLVLFTGELFAGPYHAPTLEAQYVFKDIVLLAAGVVIAIYALMQHPAVVPEARSTISHPRGITYPGAFGAEQAHSRTRLPTRSAA